VIASGPGPSALALAAHLSAWRPPRSSVGIVALGQAGFALRSGADLVLIDPFLSPRPDRLADPVVDPRGLLGVTLVLATHEHGDHLDLPTWALIAEASPAARFVVPEPLLPLVAAAGIPGDRVTGVRIGSPVEIGGVRATPVPARHAVRIEDGYSLSDDGDGPQRFVGYVIEVDGVRLYHAGDTLADAAIVRAVDALHPDIALLPINGRDPGREARGVVGNLSPDEAAELARDLSVGLAIPMHFDAIRGNEGEPDAFVRAMRRRHPTAAVWVPGSGAAFVWPAGETCSQTAAS
jgi:L-ascorbate metabolism protein UlaG (beta-lactamase superfamily)